MNRTQRRANVLALNNATNGKVKDIHVRGKNANKQDIKKLVKASNRPVIWQDACSVRDWTAAGTRQPDPERAAPGGTVGLSMSALKQRKRKEYLTVKDLQKLLDSCTLHLHEVDEVWPKIYIGNA